MSKIEITLNNGEADLRLENCDGVDLIIAIKMLADKLSSKVADIKSKS